MAMEIYIPIITSLILAVPGIWALVVQRRRSTADTADLYQQIAARQADENAKLEACQDELEHNLRRLRREMEQLVDKFEALRGDYDVLADDYDALSAYVDELIRLMAGAGINPEKTKPVRRWRRNGDKAGRLEVEGE